MKTVEEIREVVSRLYPQLGQDEDTFKSAVVLLAGVVVGANADRVARFTGLPRSFVRARATRLRKSGVWVGSATHHGWCDEKGGDIAFWCDVLVASGLLVKTTEAARAGG